MEAQAEQAEGHIEMREVGIGAIVGFVLDEGDPGQVRPAIVVHKWSHETVQLQVFTDGDGGDYNDGLPNVIWRTSVPYNPDKTTQHTWHFLD